MLSLNHWSIISIYWVREPFRWMVKIISLMFCPKLHNLFIQTCLFGAFGSGKTQN